MYLLIQQLLDIKLSLFPSTNLESKSRIKGFQDREVLALTFQMKTLQSSQVTELHKIRDKAGLGCPGPWLFTCHSLFGRGLRHSCGTPYPPPQPFNTASRANSDHAHGLPPPQLKNFFLKYNKVRKSQIHSLVKFYINLCNNTAQYKERTFPVPQNLPCFPRSQPRGSSPLF